MPVKLANISAIAANATGQINIPADINLTGTPDPAYRINGVTLAAANVTNAVSTVGSYSDPAWITGLAWSKLTGSPTTAQVNSIQTPWTSNIGGGNYTLSNVQKVSVGTTNTASSTVTINSDAGQTGQLRIIENSGNFGWIFSNFANLFRLQATAFDDVYGNPAVDIIYMDPTTGRVTIGGPPLIPPSPYPLSVAGDVNITGNYYRNGTALSFNPAGANGQIQFNNNGSLGGSANLFWDDTNSRLGVGTTSPGFALDVTGDINFSGALRRNWLVYTPTPWTSNVDGGNARLFNIQRIGIGVPTGPLTSTPLMIKIRDNENVQVGGGGTPTGAAVVCVRDDNSTYLPLSLNMGGDVYISTGTGAASGGRVAIGPHPGAAQPAYMVDIVGDVNIDAASHYRIDGTPIGEQSPWTGAIDGDGQALNNAGRIGIGVTPSANERFVVQTWTPVNYVARIVDYQNDGGANVTAQIHSDQTYDLSTNTYTGAVLKVTAYPSLAPQLANNQGNILMVGTDNSTGTTFNPYLVVKAADGYVGVGCSDPRGTLEVSTDKVVGFRGITTSQFYDGPHSAVLWMVKGRGTRATPAPVQVGDSISTVVMEGVSNGGTLVVGATISNIVTAVGSGTLAADLSFATNSGSANPTERLRITSSGLIHMSEAIMTMSSQVPGHDADTQPNHFYIFGSAGTLVIRWRDAGGGFHSYQMVGTPG